MVTVRAFRIHGLKLWFWSDDHDPPHFLAKRSGEWEVKVEFLLNPDDMPVLIWSQKRPSRKLLKQLCCLAEENRVELLQEWTEIHDN